MTTKLAEKRTIVSIVPEHPAAREIKERLGVNLPIAPAGYQVLVAIYVRPKVTKSGIHIPDQTLQEDEYQGKVGLVLSWGPELVRQRYSEPAGHELRDLWDCVEVDNQAMADLTGWGLPQVLATFRQAQGLRLIWPDGSLADPLAQLLDQRMKDYVRSDKRKGSAAEN